MMPYNGQLFSLSDQYDKVFHQKKFAKIDISQHHDKTQQLYKIKYEMNILPLIGMHIGNNNEKVNPDISLMHIICESNELNLFNCDVV